MKPPAATKLECFEKVGHRAAFTPTRIALALRWTDRVRLAAAGAGIAARRLLHREALVQTSAGVPSVAALTLIDDPAIALASGAEPLHPNGNLLHSVRHRRGNLQVAANACLHWVEDHYETPRQMHACLETKSGVVEPDGAGGWVIRFGCHNPERDRRFIAAMLDLPIERIRVLGDSEDAQRRRQIALPAAETPTAAAPAWYGSTTNR